MRGKKLQSSPNVSAGACMRVLGPFIDGLLDVAVGVRQGLLAIHHARTRLSRSAFTSFAEIPAKIPSPTCRALRPRRPLAHWIEFAERPLRATRSRHCLVRVAEAAAGDRPNRRTG